MAYDRMDWHYGAEDFPSDLMPENGGTHIGMFLAWAINNNLEGEIHRDESQESLKKLRSRKITGREFLEQECDEKFWEDDLNEEGNEFAKYYYDSDKYIEDYDNTLGDESPSLYYVQDTWINYDKLAPIISMRHQKWKRRKNRKWWQVWK